MQTYQIIKYHNGEKQAHKDHLSIEAPLEIQLLSGSGKQRRKKPLAITMRTPGQDWELSLGFLYTEGIISNRADVVDWQRPQRLGKEEIENVIELHLHPKVGMDLDRLHRHFYTSSSCGICGKTSIELVSQHISHLLPHKQPPLHAELLYQLPGIMRQYQQEFQQTGGIHGVGLFDIQGNCLFCFEDVGRHNALDKLIGAAVDQGILPLDRHILLVSGRASFELVQKALMAGIPVMAAVGAPSSLAVDLAEVHGMTLIGFLKNQGFNIYAGAERFTT